MFSPSLFTLLLTLFLNTSASASASPLPFSDLLSDPSSSITLPLAKRFNHTGSANVVKFDQARAKAIRARSQQNGGSSAVEYAATSGTGKAFNQQATSQVVSYVVTLLVDTGSSNTWVGAAKPYMPSESTEFTGDAVAVEYGSGAFAGFEVLDTITLADGLTLYNQSIGVALTAEGFDGIDGILGYVPHLSGSFPTNPDKCVPTVTDTAWDAGLLDHYAVGISFHPSEDEEQINGELTYGGVDRTKFDGPIHYVPLTTTPSASEYVGYDQSITYGDNTTILRTSAGILDTGTTLILIATDAFQEYQNVTGGVPDDDTGLLRITEEQYGNLQDLYFNIGEVKYALTPNAQIWPRALNEEIGGTTDGIYLIVNDLGSLSGQGLDFINGMSFLERFYAVYDIGNSRVGLAETPYTRAETN
ncbi:aspartic peptidase A1 [Cubamyces sp. BRFM 1775]|nr:aspartic peptidase A1 [Cubamyces sp. BRFM 1775]